jgi:hypothetical protein
MPRKSGTTDAGNSHDDELLAADAEEETPDAETGDGGSDLVVTTATVGVICVGAALFEAALIPGMIIGVCAMLVPKALPRLGTAVEPVFRGAVRGTYKLGQKARHIMAEAGEQVQDIVAEENAATATAKSDV